MIDTDIQLKIADELISLKRGHDELLLANGFQRRPLYIKEGRRYITRFLEAVSALGTRKNIINAYPHEVKLLDVLLDYGIVIPRDNAAQNKQSEKFPGSTFSGKKRSMSLYLLLSQSCNMRCVYCLDGSASYQIDKNLKMSREIAFKSIDRCLDEIEESGRLEVIFFGGEPLLNWPLAKEIMTYCEECLREKHRGKRRQYHFTSNLSFLPDDLIEWAKKFNISFLCDIDGPPAIHNKCRPLKGGQGSFESTAKTIQIMRSVGLKIDLRATITALNQDYLMDIAEQHKAIGGNSCAFVPVTPVNSDEHILPDHLLPSPGKIIAGMAEVYRSGPWKHDKLYPFNQYASRFDCASPMLVGCGAPYGNTPVVDVNGEVYPCIYLVGIKRFYIGNIMDDSYPNKDLLERMYADLHVDHMEDCKQCAWRYLCAGGCALGPLTVYDNPAATSVAKAYSKKIRCDYTRSMLELLLWNKATETASRYAEEPASVSSCV